MIDPVFASWLSGFIDGEGSFLIPRYNQGRYYAPRFKLNQRDDDLALLEEIREKTGLGTVCRSASGTGHPQVMWQVNAKADNLALTRMLDDYPLRSRKQRDYEIWREAVLIHNRFGQTPRLAALKEELEDVRKYVGAPHKG